MFVRHKNAVFFREKGASIIFGSSNLKMLKSDTLFCPLVLNNVFKNYTFTLFWGQKRGKSSVHPSIILRCTFVHPSIKYNKS